MSIGKRIELLLQAVNGGNQSELARAVGVSPQAVQQWIADATSPRGKNLEKVADFFGLPPSVVQFGANQSDISNLDRYRKSLKTLRFEIMDHHGLSDALDTSPDNPRTPKELADVQREIERYGRVIEVLSPSSDTQSESLDGQLERPNLEQAPGLRGKVPLISFVQAGDFVEVIDNFSPGDGEDWIDVTCPVKRHTFALRVVGDSMEPDFPSGTIIVVEPEMQPEPGDYVVAKNGEDATFKQLIRDGGDWYLKPINQRYPIKPLGETRIIGVVREAVRKFR